MQDCGLVVNKLACESQVAGGVIMGLNYALFEECILDRVTGRQVNPDMEFYKLGGIGDMPKITVHMMDMPERGVIGIGEPPTISTAAAIGNAVFNAIGRARPDPAADPEARPRRPREGGEGLMKNFTYHQPTTVAAGARRCSTSKWGNDRAARPAAPTCSTCRRSTSPSRTRSSA